MAAPVGSVRPNASRSFLRSIPAALSLSVPAGALSLALLALSCSGCASSGGELETIRAVPPYVLTVGDLVQRVRRAPDELGVRTQGVQVVGVLLKQGRPCDVRLAPGLAGCSVAETASIFADASGGTVDRRARVFVVLSSAQPLEEGSRYVLDGSVEIATDLPERWVLRAQVLARVE